MPTALRTSLGSAFVLPLITAVAGAQPAAIHSGWQLQDASLVTQPGAAVSSSQFTPTGWHAATVPGTVLASLVDDGTYPDPNYGLNNRKIPDTLCRTPWWYRTTFTAPAQDAGRHLWLRFDGINYTADVWVNGTQAGTIRGAFSRGIFDITPLVKTETPNVLAVEVHPQPHPGDAHPRSLELGVGHNGGISSSDGPTFLSSIGWDWQPTVADRNTGIWQGVFLYSTGPAVLENPYVTTSLPLPRTDSADIVAQTTVHNTSAQAVTGTLRGTIDDILFEKTIELEAHASTTVTFTPAEVSALHVNNPKLWWPNGYGPQNLHKLHFTFEINNTTSDTSDTTFGIRQIGYALPGSPNLALIVNGVPVVAKGGDWALDDSLKRIPRQRLDAALRMHKQANYTIIRNWVGQSTSEDLYELCDQYGLLIWDEFFQPNPGDGPNPTDKDLYLANVKDKLLRYRNHPSIALWCARNEGNPPKEIGDGIQSLIDQYDKVRLYQPSSSSGRGVKSSGPYYWREPRKFYEFKEAFKTETGSVSVPTLEAVKAMIPPQSWNAVDDTWAMRDFCRGAQNGGSPYLYSISNRYGELSSLADFVRKSQLANYEAFRAMYEGRFAKLFNPTTGVITWMSNPSQPSFVWQLYSHDLEPNASLFAVQKACEPVHVQLNQTDDQVEIINNTPTDLDGMQAITEIYNLDGTLQQKAELPATAKRSACTNIGKLTIPPQVSAVHFVRLRLVDGDKQLVSQNLYWRGVQVDDFTTLDAMPTAGLQITAQETRSGGRSHIRVDILNPTTGIALMTHLQLRRAQSGARVLPITYSDNYISLVAGEKRSIDIEAAEADLGGDRPLLAVDGWNVQVDPAHAGGNVRVITNEAALAHSLPPKPADGPQPIVKIDCGGGGLDVYTFGKRPAADQFQADHDFQGGTAEVFKNDIKADVPNAAPPDIYRTVRLGECTYAANMQADHMYTVRLHFIENKFDTGGRRFNVLLNNEAVLNDFDISAEVGRFKALVKEFKGIKPNAEGKVIIALRRGSKDGPVICGIEVVAER